MYQNKKSFQEHAKALKDAVTQKKGNKYVNQYMDEIMIATKKWDWGKHAQKDSRLGVQTQLQRLCSHYITSNLKIPKSCNHSFCIFGKAHDCCQEFRWIYTLNNQTPYLSLNFYQSVIHGLYPNQLFNPTHPSFEFTMNAIFDKIINEKTSNNRLIIRIDDKKTCSLLIKRIGNDALAKAFDPKTDGFRVSYVPCDQKIAISVADSVVMVLSGAIVGTGYCNLIKPKTSKSKKTKKLNNEHAIIHIFDQHLKDLNIEFFVKNGFNGNIDVAIKCGDDAIPLTQNEIIPSCNTDNKVNEDDDITYNTNIVPPFPHPQIDTSLQNNVNNLPSLFTTAQTPPSQIQDGVKYTQMQSQMQPPIHYSARSPIYPQPTSNVITEPQTAYSYVSYEENSNIFPEENAFGSMFSNAPRDSYNWQMLIDEDGQLQWNAHGLSPDIFSFDNNMFDNDNISSPTNENDSIRSNATTNTRKRCGYDGMKKDNDSQRKRQRISPNNHIVDNISLVHDTSTQQYHINDLVNNGFVQDFSSNNAPYNCNGYQSIGHCQHF